MQPLFWMNVALSIAAMLVTAALAPTIGFFRKPELTRITLVVTGAFIFGGPAAQHQALLQRQMRFGRLSSTVAADRPKW